MPDSDEIKKASTNNTFGLPHLWVRLFEMFLLSVLLRYGHMTLYCVCLFFLLVFFYMGADGSRLSEWEMEKCHFEILASGMCFRGVL